MAQTISNLAPKQNNSLQTTIPQTTKSGGSFYGNLGTWFNTPFGQKPNYSTPTSPVPSASTAASGLLDTLKQQGGSHIVTTPDGTTTTHKINAPDPDLVASDTANAQKVAASKASQSTGQDTSSGQSGTVYQGGATYNPNDVSTYQQNLANSGPGGPNMNANSTPPPYTSGYSGSPGGLFNAVSAQLANQGGSQYNQQAGTAITGLNNAGATNSQLAQNANAIGQQYGNQINQISQASTGGGGAFNGSAASLGAAEMARQAGTDRITGLTAAENAALAGNAQGLTAQSQTQSAQNEAAGQALTGQTQAQSALTSAAGAANPQLGQYGQTFYNPLNASQSGGSINLTGAPADDINTLSTAVANGMSYQTAYGQLQSAYGAAVANRLLPAIQKNNPNFNTNTNAGASAGQQKSASTPGDIASGYQTTISNLKAQQASLGANFSTLNSIASQGGISNTVPISTGIQQLFAKTAGGAGQAALTQFETQYSGIESAATALGITVPSVNTVTAAQLPGIEQQINTQIANTIAGQQSQLNSVQSGSSSGSSNNSSGGSTYSSNGVTYNLPY